MRKDRRQKAKKKKRHKKSEQQSRIDDRKRNEQLLSGRGHSLTFRFRHLSSCPTHTHTHTQDWQCCGSSMSVLITTAPLGLCGRLRNQSVSIKPEHLIQHCNLRKTLLMLPGIRFNLVNPHLTHYRGLLHYKCKTTIWTNIMNTKLHKMSAGRPTLSYLLVSWTSVCTVQKPVTWLAFTNARYNHTIIQKQSRLIFCKYEQRFHRNTKLIHKIIL